MAHHHPFKSLSALSWTTDISPPPSSDDDAASPSSALTNLVTATLADAALLIDSIPTPTPQPPTPTPRTPGRARSHTDSGVPPPGLTSPTPTAGKDAAAGGGGGRTDEQKETVKKLQREWKDLKMQQGGSANPYHIAMYKMGAKDGRGAWFARRSLHRPGEGLSGGGGGGGGGMFGKWEAALRREMQVTMQRVKETPGKEPGTGNIRGIGAERRVDGKVCEGGTMDLYHVSARFPGPTTPRDFVPLIIMPPEQKKNRRSRTPRQFMIVSRPCEHPDCPPRSGFIRGTYESVELIREVPVEKPLRRVRSSIDVSRDEIKGALDGERISNEAVLRAAKRAVGEEAESEGEGKTVSFNLKDDEDTEMAIEWLMVTRSDPGGSVPRFMVEKGTPGGIVNDAGKFLKWLSSQTMDDLTKPPVTEVEDAGQQETKPTGESPAEEHSGQLPADTSAEDHLPGGETESQEGPSASNSGIYGMFSSALGMATSVVANRVAAFAPSSMSTDSDISDAASDASDASFASAEEGSSQPDASIPNDNLEPTTAADDISTRSVQSTLSETPSQALSREPTPATGFSQAQSQHEKELGKLQQRMVKAQEKLQRAQARRRAKHSNDGGGDTSDTTTTKDKDAATKEKEKDDQALAKLHDKHTREVARQEEKYQRELQRLADKRAAEERKAAERQRKATEREEKANLAMELERVKAERDIARKEVVMLSERVGELQGQNTMLVARLGRVGVDVKGLKEGK